MFLDEMKDMQNELAAKQQEVATQQTELDASLKQLHGRRARATEPPKV